ncbi:MAG TPA: acylneuraminate cytidylyltransferase family protein [Pyrinomonadaceae bacterium]|nr:acylneuraminate cytidylyltransferase family protein [Pyrinomonadaceae bacterium]
MKVLGIIPARGGSKGVPRKNIKVLCGKPLLAYTAESALAASGLSKVVLSTEDEEIAMIGRELGLCVPFIRPIELAKDSTPTMPVVLHAMEELENQGESFDAVCLLQPTNPLRRSEHIDACIELLKQTASDSVVSVLPVPDAFNPMWTFWRNADGRIELTSGESEPTVRRQELPRAFYRDGSVYVTRSNVLRDQRSLYGRKIQSFEMDPRFAVNIDTKSDWEMAEQLIARGRIERSK